MTNQVSTFLFEHLDIRGRYIRLESEWQQWQEARHTTPAATSLLGQCAAFLALVAIDVKAIGKLTLQLRGNGEVKTLVVQCTIKEHTLQLRGMIEAPTLQTTDNLTASFADGDLALTLQNDITQSTYQSIVPIEANQANQVFAHYLAQSVQHPTTLWLSADDQKITGLLIEKMPETDLKDPDGWQRINHLASTLTNDELNSISLDELLHRLFHQEHIIRYQPVAITHHCPDERAHITEVVKSLGQNECERIISEEGKLILSNEICNRTYVFTLADIQRIFGTPVLH
ncbi:MAG: Hsp33 family molecular chaperone HslO [Thiotrichales bacterium]|jgi:molecular chaperone Hsp33|nr:Hsp33 family molecular chaperone HslO [Thiotrichales bacterium]